MTGNGSTDAVTVAKVLDVRQAKCPAPIVKAREALNGMAVGEVLRVEATDAGSILDFQGWAKTSKAIALLRQETVTEAGGGRLFVHYIEKRA